MSDCELWEGGCTNGYGETFRDGKVCYVHRVAWEDVHGPIPSGMDIHHHCERRRCRNVEHMELLCHDDHGGALGHGKLTRQQAREVRDLAGHLPHRVVSELYGISGALVSLIGSGKRWAAA